MKQLSGLDFTKEQHETSATFLDLTVYWEGTKYLTRTHQKELNLYLYVPANSAHPKGILKSIVYGRVFKFWKQNSKTSDFVQLCNQLFDRLKARGYNPTSLNRLIKEARTRIESDAEMAKKQTKEQNQIFLQLPFDPNGPRRHTIGKLFEFDALSRPLTELGIEKVTLCYRKPKNLRAILCPTKLLNNPLKH